jgi:lysophospholipase L1-like esterase
MPSTSTKRRPSRTAEWIGGILLIAGSITFALAGLELASRLNRGSEWLWHWPNFVLKQEARSAGEIDKQFVFDPQLGYAARPGMRASGVSHDDNGFRIGPAPFDSAVSPVLAVGDSFTYGDEIADPETWPNQLQGILHRKVLNAGAVGYGLDQIVLQAERQVGRTKPEILIVAFIADDLRRTEYRRLWAKEKPYFTLSDSGALMEHNVPVPRDAKVPLLLRLMREWLGWSALAETVMRRIGGSYEWQGAGVRASPSGTGEALACPLMRRLAQLGVPTLVVGLYAPPVWRLDPRPAWIVDEIRQTRAVLDCAAKAGMATLDAYGVLDRAARDRGKDEIFFNFHVSGTGNRIIAEAIADTLKKGLSRSAREVR